MGNLLAWFRDAFWSKEMELSVVGLSNAGKSTLCAAFAIGSGYAMDDMIPTVGFNMRQVKRNNVVMKIWDLGGQSRFKSLWERYCNDVAIIRALRLQLLGIVRALPPSSTWWTPPITNRSMHPRPSCTNSWPRSPLPQHQCPSATSEPFFAAAFA